MAEKTDGLCLSCWGEHGPDDPTWRMEFRGWRFGPPWLCICCGKEICARQWAFGRTCGPCDMGACDSRNRAFRMSTVHEQPAWYRMGDGQGSVDAFAATVGAEKLEAEAAPA